MTPLSQQLEGQQLDQHQLSVLARQLEGQQLDQHHIGLLLRYSNGSGKKDGQIVHKTAIDRDRDVDRQTRS